MSVVGLTLGSGANAIRPSAASAASVATSASTRALGWLRSYQAKPAASARPRTRNEASDPAHAPAPPSARPRAQQRGARPPAAAPAPPRMRAVCVAKYQPPASTSAVGASATGRPSPSSTVRSAQRGGELGVVRRDEHGRARRREPRAGARRARPCARGPCRAWARRGRPPRARSPRSTIASASRWRSPPERSRGWRSASAASPAASSAAGGSSSPTRSWSA